MRFPPGHIGIKAAADRIGVNKMTVYRWITKGVLPAKRIGSHVLIVAIEDVDRIGAGLDVAVPGNDEMPR